MLEIRILQSEDFPGCQAAEKSQLNLQVMVGIGSGSQECAKLFRGIENRILGRLRIVPDLLEVHIRKPVVYTGVFQSVVQQLICIIASIAAVSLTGFQNPIEIIRSDTSQKNILMQMRLDDQVYDPLLLNQCTAAIRTLSTYIIQPVIQIFRKGKRHIPVLFQFGQLVVVRNQGMLIALFCFFPG